MKIVTVLGIIGHTKVEKVIEENKIINKFIEKTENDKAKYSFGPRLAEYNNKLPQNRRYINTLPLLCDLFGSKSIIPVYTDKSKNIQQKVLEYEGIEGVEFREEGYISDEKDFPAVFSVINDILDSYEKVIIDITHGFRHVPVLMTISMIIENIKDINKIEHILFAKEIEPFKEYEIIDLKEYLDIANISVVLSGFNRNYTLTHNIRCINSDYQILIDLLSEFSEHILANSIITLIDSDNSLVDRILDAINKIDDKGIIGLENYLKPIKFHLNNLKRFKHYDRYLKLYQLSKQLTDKGYFLNAITLLDEAIGFYCAESFKNIDDEIKEHIDRFLAYDSKRAPLYELASQSKTLIKKLEKSNPYLMIKEKDEVDKKLEEEKEYIKSKKNKYIEELKSYSKLRNRLNEANQDITLNYVKKILKTLSEKEKSKDRKLRKKERDKTKEFIPLYLKGKIEKDGFEIVINDNNKSYETIIKDKIVIYLKSIDNINEFQKFIKDTDDLRNNLAHANSSEPLVEVKEKMKDLLNRFNIFCQTEDILGLKR